MYGYYYMLPFSKYYWVYEHISFTLINFKHHFTEVSKYAFADIYWIRWQVLIKFVVWMLLSICFS
jgi:hypothetical protein